VNLDVLEKIKGSYDIFRKAFRAAKRADLYEKVDTLDKSKEIIDDLFIVEIFSCFERFLRDKILDYINLESCKFEKKKIIDYLEYMRIEDILDSLKVRIDSHTIGFLKQIKSYRDWVAHGRNPNKLPPVRKIDFNKAIEAIKIVMSGLES
jgi:hypothetical protein